MVNLEQIKKVAAFLKVNPPETSGLNFYSRKDTDGKAIVLSDMYPKIGHPQALNFLFYVVSQDFGFWIGNELGYESPMYGEINGKKKVKGSDLMWQMAKRALDRVEDFFEPTRLAEISYESFTRELWADDRGPYPFPDLEVRFRLTRGYGRWFRDNKTTPKAIVEHANRLQNRTLRSFTIKVRQIPGFSGDTDFDKKVILLAMVLANRPEKFLTVGAKDIWPPIIDYHLERIALRLGLVEIDEVDRSDLEGRSFVIESLEQELRAKTSDAVDTLIELSGLDMFLVDEMLWMARKYCPEMSEPECDKCYFESVCKKRTRLFQPVFRTTNY